MTDTDDNTPVQAAAAADGHKGASPPQGTSTQGTSAADTSAADTSAADTSAADTSAADTSAVATGGHLTGEWQRQLADAEARAAILAAGGRPEVLMPHLREAIRLNQSADGISITCQDGEETVSLNAFVDNLRGRDGFADAFATDNAAHNSTHNAAPQEVRGSGATQQSSPKIDSIDQGNALAIGQSLVDIASGKIHISFS